MTREEEMQVLADRLAATPPSEESIELLHSKTPEELDAAVPGLANTTMVVITPDGQEMTLEEYAATQNKTADSKGKKLRKYISTFTYWR